MLLWTIIRYHQWEQSGRISYQIKILELLGDQFNFEKVKVLRKCLNFILLSVEVEQVGHLYQFSEPVSPNLTFALPIFKIWLCLPQFHSFASQIFFPLLNWKYAAPSCQLSTFNAPQEQVREITHIFDIFTNRQWLGACGWGGANFLKAYFRQKSTDATLPNIKMLKWGQVGPRPQ